MDKRPRKPMEVLQARRVGVPTLWETMKAPCLRGFLVAGATGLEPATSGVTDHLESHDGWRRWTRSRSIHAVFWLFRESLPDG
jgi:hypothetical protein